jgi:hypothetical protein
MGVDPSANAIEVEAGAIRNSAASTTRIMVFFIFCFLLCELIDTEPDYLAHPPTRGASPTKSVLPMNSRNCWRLIESSKNDSAVPCGTQVVL